MRWFDPSPFRCWRVRRDGEGAVSERARLVLRWLRYADYLAVWAEIPLVDRPRYRVVLSGDVWAASDSYRRSAA